MNICDPADVPIGFNAALIEKLREDGKIARPRRMEGIGHIAARYESLMTVLLALPCPSGDDKAEEITTLEMRQTILNSLAELAAACFLTARALSLELENTPA